MTTGSRSNKSLIPDTGGHIPEDKDQRLVVTPYGKAMVIRTRKNHDTGNVIMRELVLTEWNKPTKGRPPTLYSCTEYPSIPVDVGCDVLCIAGRGRVIEKRDNGTIVIRLSSWRLDNRSVVICYMQESTVQVVRLKEIYEMSVIERIERGNEFKSQAVKYFTKKQYNDALKLYSKAVDAIRYVQHTKQSSNTIRADLLIVMVTCSNNAATCSLKLNEWDDAYQYAQHAYVLLDALEPKKGMKIHQELIKAGHNDSQIFGEWKVKSLYIMAKADYERGELVHATENIKKGRETIIQYTKQQKEDNDNNTNNNKSNIKQLQHMDKELIKLLTQCKEKLKIQYKKEKKRALAMFGSSSKKQQQQQQQQILEEKKSDDNNEDNNNNNKNNINKLQNGHFGTGIFQNNNNNNTSEQQQYKSTTTTTTTKEINTTTSAKTITTKKDINTREDYDDENEEIPWYQDAAVLGGLGVIIGVTGTVLLLSQLASRRK